jgi:hypothetical protein
MKKLPLFFACFLFSFFCQAQEIRTFSHSKMIRSVAFSPDGNFVLTGGEDRTATLWDLQGKVWQTLKGHQGIIRSVAISPDGRYALTAGDDQTARLWNLRTGTAEQILAHTDPVGAVAFSPDGKYILTGCHDHIARLWDYEGNVIQSFYHESIIRSVAFAPNSKLVLIASMDGTAAFWNLQGKEVQKYVGHTDQVFCAAISPKTQHILTGSFDETAKIWDSKGTAIKTFPNLYWVSAVAFSPDSKFILTGSFDQTAKLWNQQGKIEQEFKGHGNWITSVAFSPDGKYVLTAGSSTAKLWDISAIKPKNVPQLPQITWNNTILNSRQKNFVVDACIQTQTPLQNMQVIVNEGIQIEKATRGIGIVPSGTCDVQLKRNITLKQGANTIKIVATNASGTTNSAVLNVNYTPEREVNIATAKRVALVIGNKDYKNSPLKNPSNDAEAIATELTKLGFEVLKYTNLNQDEMKSAILTFGQKISTSGGVGLFYFAGHGIEKNGETYLLPIEERTGLSLEEYTNSAIGLKKVLSEMSDANNAMNILILDACRNDADRKAIVGTDIAPRGTLIAYATQAGGSALDGSGKNGLYTEELVKALRQPNMRMEDVFMQVRKNVRHRSNDMQIPREVSSIEEKFYFKR